MCDMAMYLVYCCTYYEYIQVCRYGIQAESVVYAGLHNEHRYCILYTLYCILYFVYAVHGLAAAATANANRKQFKRYLHSPCYYFSSFSICQFLLSAFRWLFFAFLLCFSFFFYFANIDFVRIAVTMHVACVRWHHCDGREENRRDIRCSGEAAIQ